MWFIPDMALIWEKNREILSLNSSPILLIYIAFYIKHPHIVIFPSTLSQDGAYTLYIHNLSQINQTYDPSSSFVNIYAN